MLDGVQDLRLLVADGVGVEGDGRLHRRQCDQLQQMVRHHVAQRARAFVVTASLFDTDFLSGGNLHALDVTAIPDGFEDAVTKTKHQDVLDRFFAEIVIDAVDLIFVQDLLDFLIELFR